MKIFYLFMIILQLSIQLFAQTCEECKGKEYMYRFCLNGNTYEKCTSNPYNEPGLKLDKKCLLPNIIYKTDPYMQKKFRYDYNNDGYADPYESYFSSNDAKTQAYEAIDEWLSICSEYDNYNCTQCNLYIKWERDPEIFKKYPNCLALHTYKFNADCSIDCSKEFIYINIDQDMTGWEPPNDASSSFPTKRFFFTSSEFKEVWDVMGNEIPLYSFKTVMLHELGHWFGFGHQEENSFLWWGGCGDPGGVMGSDDKVLFSKEEWEISEDDRCMFMKIYCCPYEHTSVDDGGSLNKENNQFIIKPNLQIQN